jgi:KaiC/GvpD/RAD55 family RecA-like ATPase
LEDWLSEGGTQRPPDAEASTQESGGEGDAELGAVKDELKELRRVMKEELKEIKAGRFDPMKYIEEISRLTKELQAQVEERKKLEGEIEHIRKSSVAALKFVKTQQPTGDIEGLKKRMASEVEAKRKFEIELKKTQALLNKAREEVAAGLKKLPPSAKSLKEKEIQLVEKEMQLKALEDQIKLKEESLHAQEAMVGPPGGGELEKRMQAELAEKEREYLDREAQFKKRIIELEGEIQRLRIEEKLFRESQQILSKTPGEINRELELKTREIQSREKGLLLREDEIRRLQDEVKLKEDELKKLKEPLAYKEGELLRREEDMIYREKLLQEQLRKVELAKREGGSVQEMELRQRLQVLKDEITKKEEEVRAKEKWLQQKMQELRAREQGLVQQEIEASEEIRKMEIQQERAKTGTSRLDDLLLGGVPFGSNLTIYGPPFIGKEVVVNAFMAEGLKKGVPVIWVITDKMPSDIREEMKYILPSYEEYEKMGLVRYVDAYSKSMGAESEDANTVFINDPTDHEAILKAVDEVAKEFKAKYPYYRLAFRSISTLIAYLDPTVTFKFLQPFAGRRKRDRAVSMYMIEKGMHGEQEIQMLGSVMDGMIDFKVEQLKTFMSIKGIGDVQSRAWIQYMYSKQGVSIGSFSLDHIK